MGVDLDRRLGVHLLENRRTSGEMAVGKKMSLPIRPVELLGLKDTAEGVLIPHALNHNDKDTLFAGSLFSAAVIAGYRKAAELLDNCGEVLVAKTCSINYRRPVSTEGAARVLRVTDPFIKPNGNRTVTVVVGVFEGEALCAEFEGVYVQVPTAK